MSALLELVLGGVLLVLGRKLFWLFVAGVGFAVGMFVTPLLLPDAPQGVTLAVAVALAVLGAVLAITVQKIAIGLVGFIAGGLIALWLLRALALDLGTLQWLVFIGGGILGALLLGDPVRVGADLVVLPGRRQPSGERSGRVDKLAGESSPDHFPGGVRPGRTHPGAPFEAMMSQL